MVCSEALMELKGDPNPESRDFSEALVPDDTDVVEETELLESGEDEWQTLETEEDDETEEVLESGEEE